MASPAADPNVQYVWYLGYGSNMNPAVLTGRRRVHPIEAKACRVPGYKLDSYIRGYPYIEPSFFSVSRRTAADAEPELHGVVFRITRKDYDQIRATEGGGGHPTLGYQDEFVKVITYDGQTLDAVTLKTSARSTFPGHIVSQRYLNVCLVGARHHKLDAAYIAWMESLPRYTRRPVQWVAAIGLFAVVGPFILPLYIGSLLWRRFTGLRVQWTYEVIHYAAIFVWLMHDYFMRFIFGDGGTLRGAKPVPAIAPKAAAAL